MRILLKYIHIFDRYVEIYITEYMHNTIYILLYVNVHLGNINITIYKILFKIRFITFIICVLLIYISVNFYYKKIHLHIINLIITSHTVTYDIFLYVIHIKYGDIIFA